MSLHDTMHDMYQPDKRALRVVAPLYVEADPNGNMKQREAWMRQRQALKAMKSICARTRRIEQILRNVCDEYAVSRTQLLGRSRRHSVAQARGQVCRALREMGLSYPEVAEALNLDHTTVMYHCQILKGGVL